MGSECSSRLEAGRTVEKEMGQEQKKTGAIILAAGKGTRMHSDVQKQYMILKGKPLILYSLEAFEESPVQEIVLVVGVGETETVKKNVLEKECFKKSVTVVEGGRERYHSVYAGLQALSACGYVLIHDGARPLITRDIIYRAIEGARKYQACVVGMPVKDTIKVSDEDGFSEKTLKRAKLWQIQTPQAFSYDLARSAYDWIMEDMSRQEGVTDDAMVVEKWGGPRVKMIEGSYENLKVTTPEDLVVAEALIGRRGNLK